MDLLDSAQLERFARQQKLELVALFGSSARGAEAPSDLDVAVLPQPGTNLSTLELARAFMREFRRGDIDLTSLHSASALLWEHVARDGVALFEADPGTFRQFRQEAARRAWEGSVWRNRNRRFVKRMLEGALELDRNLVYQGLATLAEYLRKLEECLRASPESFEAEFRVHHSAERLLELLVECAAQINTEVGQAVAGVPSSDYYSSFFALSGAGWISGDLARELAELASLRNILVHRYQQIATAELYRDLHRSLPFWREYLAGVTRGLEAFETRARPQDP